MRVTHMASNSGLALARGKLDRRRTQALREAAAAAEEEAAELERAVTRIQGGVRGRRDRKRVRRLNEEKTALEEEAAALRIQASGFSCEVVEYHHPHTTRVSF